jgi:GNAT superfamily N-acetyltransferase
MFRLDTARYPALFDQYKSTRFFFPLVGAVLSNQQNGEVYVNDLNDPRQAYVEHAFGFAQIFGDTVAGFESDLERYLLIEKQFTIPKVRLYGTYLPEFLCSQEFNAMRSFRQRFLITPELLIKHVPGSMLKVCGVDSLNISEIEEAFGVVGRFWRSPDDFIQKANGVVVYCHDQLAGICYAAAEADHRVEIDVLTLPEFRRLGVGRLAVAQFVAHCFSQSLQPLWDCFTNNEGSMRLSRTVGFSAINEPYPFFTINKHNH